MIQKIILTIFLILYNFLCHQYICIIVSTKSRTKNKSKIISLKVGWDIYCINKYLTELYDSESSVYLLLRKMPKDHMVTLKQQQQQQQNRFYLQAENTKKQSGQNANKNNNHQRKHSFSNIFLT